MLNLAFEDAFEHGFEPLREPDGGERGPAADGPQRRAARGGRRQAALGGRRSAKTETRPSGRSRIPIWRAAEARLLAQRIAELAGPDGPFDPGDVAVLVRASTDIALYERAIADEGLPTYVAGGGGYFSQQQVGDLRAYLAALANPLDELALYSLLASPLVGASLDALALIGLRARELGRNVWWTLSDGLEAVDGLARPTTRRARWPRSSARFAAEREEAPRLALETLIDRAVTRSGYDRVVLRMPDGERRMANVRKLMRLAREYEADEGRDLRGFIDFVAEQDMLRAREGEAPLETEGIQAVRLMTIHAAKGLEFPVVCVADLGRVAFKDDDALRVTDDGRVGLSVASIGRRFHQGHGARGDRGGAAPARRPGGAAGVLRGDDARPRAPDRQRRHRPREVARAQAARRADGLDLARARAGPPDPGHRGRVRARDAGRARGAGALRGVHAGGCWRQRCRASRGRRVRWRPRTARRRGGVQPALLAAVEAAGAPPLGRLSYSSLENYRRCSYRFYLERVARLGLKAAELADAAGEPVPEGLGQAAARHRGARADGAASTSRGRARRARRTSRSCSRCTARPSTGRTSRTSAR